MFIRCLRRNTRLTVYVLTADREGAKVHQRQVAYLGSLYIPPPRPTDPLALMAWRPHPRERGVDFPPLLVMGRDLLWTKLLTAIIENHIDKNTAAKLRRELQVHVPRPTAKERAKAKRDIARGRAALETRLAGPLSLAKTSSSPD
jgi:hypothetical protein